MMAQSKKRSLWALIWFSFFCYLLISITTKAHWVKQFDGLINTQLHQILPDTLQTTIITITTLGNPASIFLLVVLTTICLLSVRQFAATLFVIFNVSLFTGLNHFIKLLIARPRPPYQHLVAAGGYSFPSGHAAGSLLFFGSLWILSLYFIPKRQWRLPVQIVCVLLPLLIGLSRIYVQVHYPTDVLAGWLLALTCLNLAWLGFEKRKLLPSIHY